MTEEYKILEGYKEEFVGSSNCDILYIKAIGHYKHDLLEGLIIHFNIMDTEMYKSHAMNGKKIGCEFWVYKYQDSDKIIILSTNQRFYDKTNKRFGEEVAFK